MIFTPHTVCGTMRRESSAQLAPSHDVFISRRGRSNTVELALYGPHSSTTLRFTPAQARTVAAELLACAHDGLANGKGQA